jgi:hypothetical protein
MLHLQFPGVNHKRVYRLFSAATLAERKRRTVKQPLSERVPLHMAQTGQRGVEYGVFYGPPFEVQYFAK